MKTSKKPAKIKTGKTKSKSSAKKVKTSKVKSSTIVSLGPLTRKTDRTALKQNTWVVFKVIEGAHDRKPMMFPGTLGRDAVRSAYARSMKTDRIATRSRRLKNY